MRQEAILDIGSSKVVCLMAGQGTEGRLEVYGTGYADYAGLRKRSFLDVRSLREAMLSALDQAQSEARRSIRRLWIGVPGPFVDTFCRKGELLFETPQEINDGHVNTLIAQSLDEDEMSGFIHLHSVPVSLKLDGTNYISLPPKAQCQNFSGIFSHIYMREECKDIMEGILEKTEIDIQGFVDSIFSECLLLVPERRRKEDSVIVDIGYYHCDICIMRNKALIYHNTLNVGGAHLARDISYVLGIAHEEAEAVKRRHVFGLNYTNRDDDYKMQEGGVQSFQYETIQSIIEARAAEMAEMIGDALRMAVVEVGEDTPIFLCGGGVAMMRGGREFFQSKLGMMVSTEIPPMPRRNSANFTSGYGVLKFALSQNSASKTEWKDNKVIQAIIGFFRK